MSFVSTNRNSSNGGVMFSRPTSFEHSVTSAHAAPPPSTLISRSAMLAPGKSSLRTRAGTGITPSASPRLGINGWRRRRPICCRFPTAMWYSHCLRSFLLWPGTTRGSSTDCCSAPSPKRCSPFAADSHRLRARLGFLAVLHTWNQKMLHHPHLHCLIPVGGLSLKVSVLLRRHASRHRQDSNDQVDPAHLGRLPEHVMTRSLPLYSQHSLRTSNTRSVPTYIRKPEQNCLSCATAVCRGFYALPNPAPSALRRRLISARSPGCSIQSP